MKALKQDLQRTILAHKHNQELVYHHGNALDDVNKKLDTYPKIEQVNAQIKKFDQMLRIGQNKQKEFDHISERLMVMEEQFSNFLPFAMMPSALGLPSAPLMPAHVFWAVCLWASW